MATWDTSIPAIANDLSSDLTKIKDNFGILATAWNGDHQNLATDGSGSTYHEKVTLPVGTATKVSGAGILYTKDTGGISELFYRNDNGVSGDEVQITSGPGAAGGADVFCVFDGSSASPITPSNYKNASSVTRTADGAFTINFDSNLNGTDYVVQITASSGSVNYITHTHGYNRLADSFSFTVYRSLATGGTPGLYNSRDINVAIFRNG